MYSNPESGYGFDGWTSQVKCECGKVYKESDNSVNASRVNGIANGCVSCKPDRHQREIIKASDRIRLRLARHIAACRQARKKRIIYRDVACRYLQRFGGQTFGVQTDVDACEVYLENANGMIIGKVSTLDLYPKGFDDVIVDEIPY